MLYKENVPPKNILTRPLSYVATLHGKNFNGYTKF